MQVSKTKTLDPIGIAKTKTWVCFNSKPKSIANQSTTAIYIHVYNSHETILQITVQQLWTTSFTEVQVKQKLCVDLVIEGK